MKETDFNTFGLRELDYISLLDKQDGQMLRDLQKRLLVLDYDDDIKKIIDYIDTLIGDVMEHSGRIEDARQFILNDMQKEV